MGCTSSARALLRELWALGATGKENPVQNGLSPKKEGKMRVMWAAGPEDCGSSAQPHCPS